MDSTDSNGNNEFSNDFSSKKKNPTLSKTTAAKSDIFDPNMFVSYRSSSVNEEEQAILTGKRNSLQEEKKSLLEFLKGVREKQSKQNKVEGYVYTHKCKVFCKGILDGEKKHRKKELEDIVPENQEEAE